MNISKKKTLYLIDGSATIYRSFYAFIRNPLVNSKGEDTSATYGVLNSLLKIIKDEKPDYMAVVLDTKAPTFRHKRYPEYKGTRAKMPEELVDQLPRIREAIEALNLPIYEMEGYEADDIIGTFAKQGEEAGLDVWCVTGDKDFYQLVTDNVHVYTTKSAGEPPARMGREEVRAKFGVPPELVIDKLGLMGDNSDNVPGIPGVGPKTADSLLEQFGSLEAVLDGWEQIKAKGLRAKVQANRELALLSKELVTIKIDTPIEFDLEKMKRTQINFEAAKQLCVELEFTRMLKLILPDGDANAGADTDLTDNSGTASRPATKVDYNVVTDLSELKKLIKRLSKAKEIAVDTETTSLNTLEAKLVGVSFSDLSGRAWYLPVGHTGEGEPNLPFDEAIALIKQLLEDPKVQKFGQNIKYDLEVLHRYDIDIDPVSYDTMLASYVIDPSSRQHGLDAQVARLFDYNMQPISDLIGKGKKQITFDRVPIHTATFYACEDADFTFRLRAELASKVEERSVASLLYNIELPLIKVLASMEEAGVRVDAEFLEIMSVDLGEKLDSIIIQIYAQAGGEFNINSTQQLSHILFDKLGLPTKGRTAKKTGFSTDVKVLEELAEIHDFPKLILKFRQWTKLKSTYVDALPRLINAETGRVHTSFNQTIAATGRLSSTDPNLQNIPVRTEEGRRIRKAFVPRDETHTLLVADYSQIELRILAHYSDDEGLIKAFINNEDIHARTAAEVYGVEISEVTSEQRRAAKTANFAVIYGASAYGLAQQTQLDLSGARSFIDTYFERYPGIRDYMDRTKEGARRDGYVTTMFNRRRYLPEINSKNHNIRQFAERIAINTPIQGTAADMIKKAMINIHNKMIGMRSAMILQVHDELIFDVHKDELEKVRKIVKTGMEKAVKLKVPVLVDMGAGDNWLDAK